MVGYGGCSGGASSGVWRGTSPGSGEPYMAGVLEPQVEGEPSGVAPIPLSTATTTLAADIPTEPSAPSLAGDGTPCGLAQWESASAPPVLWPCADGSSYPGARARSGGDKALPRRTGSGPSPFTCGRSRTCGQSAAATLEPFTDVVPLLN